LKNNRNSSRNRAVVGVVVRERKKERREEESSRINKKKNIIKNQNRKTFNKYDEQRTNRTRRSKPLLSNAIDSRTLGTNVTLLS
jgi:hypothetical protein